MTIHNACDSMTLWQVTMELSSRKYAVELMNCFVLVPVSIEMAQVSITYFTCHLLLGIVCWFLLIRLDLGGG